VNKKIRVCLAIGDIKIEEWLKDKLSEYCIFCGEALHRGNVLQMINENTPEVLVLDSSLPTSQLDGISIDLLVHKIRVTFPSCRIVLICGEQGDSKFLNNMVNKGVYDICAGETVQIREVCDMILKPRDYSYASKFQEAEIVADKDAGIEQAQIVEKVVTSVPPKKSVLKQPKQGDTAILTSDKLVEDNLPVIPCIQGGIVFYPNSYQTLPNNMLSNNMVPQNNYGQGSGYGTPSAYQPAYQNSVSSNGKIITYTACRDGVGCTSSAINTAFAFADMGRKVLLIDANRGRSCIYQKLGLSEIGGYTFQDVARSYANKNEKNHDFSRAEC